MVKVVEAAREARSPILAPANVLAEWWRGRTDRREHVRKMFVVQDVNEQVAKLAGEALAWLKRRRADAHDKVTIDATVMGASSFFDERSFILRCFRSRRTGSLMVPQLAAPASRIMPRCRAPKLGAFPAYHLRHSQSSKSHVRGRHVRPLHIGGEAPSGGGQSFTVGTTAASSPRSP
jgi:hypothetical protein